jgi:hypothetical protein
MGWGLFISLSSIVEYDAVAICARDSLECWIGCVDFKLRVTTGINIDEHKHDLIPRTMRHMRDCPPITEDVSVLIRGKEPRSIGSQWELKSTIGLAHWAEGPCVVFGYATYSGHNL